MKGRESPRGKDKEEEVGVRRENRKSDDGQQRSRDTKMRRRNRFKQRVECSSTRHAGGMVRWVPG